MVSVSVFHICFCLLNWNLPYRIFVRLSAKFRFIGVNITNLQQIVSVFELYRKLLGDNAPVRDRHRPFSFLSVIRFSFECFPDCDIRDFLRLVAFLNILDGVETVLLNISESRKQDGTAVYIYPTIVKIDSIAVFPTCMG